MRDDLVSEVDGLPMGDVTDFRNFMGAVIDDRSFAKLSAVIDRVRGEEGVEIVAGGVADDTVGLLRPARPWCVADNPDHEVFTTEYFGPILGVFVYDDADYDTVLRESAAVGPYGLTGADHRPGSCGRSSRRWTCCGSRRATSTSTTSRPVRWSASSRSAGPAAAGPTTRPARS